ncbi:UPF0182 family protein [Cronbergia sp. UHCC 0137]|uniref:UPF0182 family protein n=1 Tax=Cronbergia sp. UHCC 0137 TaxID=3110239 RepID=UPI002B1F6D3F|nr:UPF0182 family protein [Cronbergia sp. UHCC 0137]MEA5617142.1 UPF0182 family protein [Cronbergia sp. UHCC 0137]
MIWKWGFRFLIIFLGLLLFLLISSHLGAEIFWFQEVGYLQIFSLRIITKAALWLVVASITATYLFANLTIAQRLKHQDQGKKALLPSSMRLRWLLPVILVLTMLVGLLVAYYGQIGLTYWQKGIDQASLSVPILLRPEIILQMGRQMISQVWGFGMSLGIAIILLVYPQISLRAIALVLSIGFGWMISQHWGKFLLYFHSIPFNSSEPLFNQDIGFYIFSLPFWELLGFWLIGLCLYGFISVLLTYLLSADSLSQGFFPGFSPPQQRHLCGLGGCLMLVVALSYWLSRYELVYSPRGVSFGASYTDVNIQLPADTALCILAVGIATYLLGLAFFWKPKPKNHQLVISILSIYLVLVVVGDIIIPTVVQYLIVQPNELKREQPYIERTIALTRQAFDLNAIDAITFNPQGQLTQADLKINDLTIRNIRLWDQEPLLKTNRQLQQIRPYYRFPDADIDRYTIKTEPSAIEPTEKRQVLIAARELDYNNVPQQAQTWVNRNLIYTHGYGFTMSPVNTVAPGGLPEYFVKDIAGNNENPLTTSSPAIRESIPIGQPRIYYGEIANTHVMTGTRVRELDYPSGSDNVYNVYDGSGGITIGSLWRRWLFAAYLKDWQMVFTRDFLPETKVLFRRNINERIRAIAPFLQFDSDPYLVAADTEQGNGLYWIIDGYTKSDRYPYSDTGEDGINYIRNSVKIVIDAYNGTVNFYIADSRDPLIKAWSEIFPDTFKPLNTMPVNLRSHIRYPVDYFKIQSDRLMIYHITSPQVFYNREDQWQIPNEIYGTETRQLEPYYLITSLPNVPFEEFLLLLPYTPKQRTNLIAWLAARSDGENYGKLLIYIFPKERLIYGTEQIEARINQDPVISQQISLWNRQGSRAIQGNLLIIPIEQSLLYVEPIYLEATQNSLPTLVRVVVAYENRIVMTQTLEQALQAIFQPETTPAPAIIRPVEEEGVPPVN